MSEPYKFGMAVRLSEYDLAMMYGGEFRRRVRDRIETPPTDADWAEYRDGVALLEKLRENRFYREGGPDEGSEIEEPRPSVRYVYAETEGEWRERIRHLPIPEETIYQQLARQQFSFVQDAIDRAQRMTARDFTPTDEQVEALAKGEVGDDDWGATPEPAKVILRKWAREDLARPAFQSIIAAAKAEARAEIVEELEAIDLIVPSETSEHEWGIDEATRAIIKLIRSKDEASA